MADCREWQKTIFKASFKGAPFAVNRDTISVGRRLVVHEYPTRDVWDTEDLGQAAQRIDLTCYTFGPSADADAERLLNACMSGGPGTLILPIMPARQARAERADRTFSADEMGRFELRITFVLESGGIGGLFQFQYLLGAFTSAIGLAANQAASGFDGRYNALVVPNVAREAASVTIGLASSALAAIASTLPLSPGKAPLIRSAIERLASDAYQLAQQGTGANVLSRTAYSATQRSIASSLGFRVMDIVASIAAACPDKKRLASKLDGLAEFTAQEINTPYNGVTVKAELALTESIGKLVATAGLIKWTEAVVIQKYPTRAEAVTARAAIADRLAYEIDAALDFREADALAAVRSMAVRFLTKNGAELPRVVHIDTVQPAPALVLAYELYGDPGRDAEIINRNAVRHPLLCQTGLEVLVQ